MLEDRSLNLIPNASVTSFEMVGAGGFGAVYRGEWQGVEVAVKRLHGVAGSPMDEIHEVKGFLKEISTLSRLRHPNCVVLYGIVIDISSRAIVTEFVAGGCLMGFLKQIRALATRSVTESQLRGSVPTVDLEKASDCAGAIWERADDFLPWYSRRQVLRECAMGCSYLHSLEPPILHRDLKSPNILITGPPEDLHAKVCDFGLAAAHRSSVTTAAASIGTVQWCAPEVLRDESAGAPSDVFSFGVIAWEMASLSPPYDGVPAISLAHKLAYGEATLQAPQGTPPWLVNLFEAACSFEPSSRPTFEEIVQGLETSAKLSTDETLPA